MGADGPGTPLPSSLLVVEVGERIAVGACGSLLAQLGAQVVLVEPRTPKSEQKWRNRAMVAAGKRSIVADAADRQAEPLKALLQNADAVILSSDLTPCNADWRADQIVCDITAFGDSGPLSGLRYSDAMVQAVSGILDTTGHPTLPPTPVGFPILEFCAGIYAAAAIVVALRVRRLHGAGQSIDIALFDCAMSTLSTFLPFHMTGKPVTRAGNGHSLAAPWNAYHASDGWVLICTATDEQWQRLCNAMQKRALARAAGYITNAERVAHRSDVDNAVQNWVSTRDIHSCIECLTAVGIPCGPITTVAGFAGEPNLLHRGMIRTLRDPLANRDVMMPEAPFKATASAARLADHIPLPGAHQQAVASLYEARTVASAHSRDTAPRAFAGLRVLEIGQYTTAPLVARQLGALGAEVLKIEPPGGEGSRGWPPNQGDQGYFFTFSNSDKKSLMMDLRGEEDKAAFRDLLQTADVLVENLKPGSLDRLGFGAAQLEQINPRLVYCSISGFGADSAYPQRAAFDTVVQAMSGFMDLTRVDGTPTKAGISAADIVGGTYGLLAILAALEHRERSGRGEYLDISMQDVACWATQSAWNDAPRMEHRVVVCSDGCVLIEGNVTASALAQRDARFAEGWATAREYSRRALTELAEAAGLMAAPVLTVSEAADSAQAAAREAVIFASDSAGRRWPLLNSPLRLKLTPARVVRPIGKLGEANDQLMRRG